MRRAAVEGVEAYLAGEDADVHNITDAAVQENAVMAALNLTTLAAAAVTALAEATGRTPYEALRSIDHAGVDQISRQRGRARSETRPCDTALASDGNECPAAEECALREYAYRAILNHGCGERLACVVDPPFGAR
jgi:hypothetical protein